MVSQYRIAHTVRLAPAAHNSPETPVKLTNLTITPKLGILVGVTLFGLCVAGALAGYLMQREMLNARIDQVRSIVDIARNMATGCRSRSRPASSPRKPRSPNSAAAPIR